MKILQGKPIWLKWLIGIVSFIIYIVLLGVINRLVANLFKIEPLKDDSVSYLFLWGFPIVFYLMVREHTVYEIFKTIVDKEKKRKAASIMQIQCPNCKYEGAGKFIVKGSMSMELVLWICFIIPGLIYSTWRLNNKKWICPRCDFEHVVKLGMG